MGGDKFNEIKFRETSILKSKKLKNSDLCPVSLNCKFI